MPGAEACPASLAGGSPLRLPGAGQGLQPAACGRECGLLAGVVWLSLPRLPGRSVQGIGLLSLKRGHCWGSERSGGVPAGGEMPQELRVLPEAEQDG